MSTAEKLKAIANTLETLEIKATGSNVSKLTAVYQLLNEIILKAEEYEKAQTEEAVTNGAG